MRPLVFSLFFWCFCVAPCFAQSKKSAEVLATEQSRFEAMTNRDTVALARLLAPDLVYIHSNALQESKSTHIGAIVQGKLVYQSMNREKASVRFFGKTAITNGTILVKGILNGNPFDIHLLYTAVYRKQKRVWQLVNWQSTRIP
jgi:ketosteroid isomerase-like protein